MLYLQFPMMKSLLFKKFKEDLTNTVLSNVNKIGFVAAIQIDEDEIC